MPTEKKAKTIDSLKEMFSRSSVGVFTDYRGMKVGEITDLRRNFRKSKIEFHVVKNTLARIAAEQAGKKQVMEALDGPLAIAFGSGEPVEPARILSDFIRTSKLAIKIRGGFMGDRVLTPAEVETLARLPSREVLIAQVMGGMQAPIAYLMAYLSSPVSGLMGILQARISQMEGK